MVFKQMLTATTLFATLVSSATFADDEEKQEKNKRIEIRVEARYDEENDETKGKTGSITVTEDGKTTVYDLAEGIPEKLKDRLKIAVPYETDGSKNNPLLEGFFVPNEIRLKNHDESIWIADPEKKEEPRYMIGVACEKVNEILGRHLKLKGYGLLVTQVTEDWPAAKADLGNGDILLEANGKKLDNTQALMDVITKSAGKPVNFVVLQSGERAELKIQPRKGRSSFIKIKPPIEVKGSRVELRENPLRQLGPGFRIKRGQKTQMPEEVLELLEKMEGLEGIRQDMKIPEWEIDVEVEEAEEALGRVEREVRSTSRKMLEQQLKAMQRRLANMEKQLKELNKNSTKDN